MAAKRQTPSGSTGDEGVENGSIGFSRGLVLAGLAIVVLALLPFVISRASGNDGSDGTTDVANAAPIEAGQGDQGAVDQGDQGGAGESAGVVPQSNVSDPAALPFGIPEALAPLTVNAYELLAQADPGLITPPNRGIVTEASPAFSGVASASSGVSDVSIIIASASLNRAWSRDPLEATLANPGETESEWSLSTETLYVDRPDLWSGQYLIAITTTGTDGEAEVTYGQFWVERRSPLVQMIEPLGNEVLTSPELVIAGTARDDVELALVEVALVDESGNWLQPDGSFRGRRTDMSAETTGLGVPAGQWNLTTTLPAPGRFTAFVTAYAWDGKKSVRRRTFDFNPAGLNGNPGNATILMSRSLLGVPANCGDNPTVREDSVNLTDVAEALTERGIAATATVTPDRHAQSVPTCHSFATTTVSWDTLDDLRDTHGWTFVSHGQTYTGLDTLSPDEQTEESCGSLTELAENGHDDAWGLFAYPNNKFTDESQEDIVSTCFAYGRVYGAEYNAAQTLSDQRLVSVFSVTGGHCNEFQERCFNANLMNAGRRYTPPSELIRLMDVPDDHWVIVQFYRFVTGVNEVGFERWDCTDTNADKHWTNSGELYCWDDFLSVVDSIRSDVNVTDPASIARFYGNDIAQAG